jgi:hypothetical protein
MPAQRDALVELRQRGVEQHARELRLPDEHET